MEKLERGFWFSYTQDEEEEEAGYVQPAVKVKNILRWSNNLKSNHIIELHVGGKMS